jgi:hypothetical protein
MTAAPAPPPFPAQPLYFFIDEGGNLDFNPTGSRFFTLTSVTIPRPFPFESPFTELKFDLLPTADIEYFHATEDRQAVRNSVFAIIRRHLHLLHVDTLLVEKTKTPPSLRSDTRFYPETLGNLLRHIVSHLDPAALSTLVVMTDRIPVNKKRQSIEKAVKETLAATLPPAIPYRVLHHDSKSCAGLQVADYINWAIFRNAERGDPRSFDLIKAAIRSHRILYP